MGETDNGREMGETDNGREMGETDNGREMGETDKETERRRGRRNENIDRCLKGLSKNFFSF